MTIQPLATYDLFPSGDSVPLAELRVEPEAIARHFHLPLAEGEDDLGAFRYVILSLGERSPAFLYKYQESDEVFGTLVRVDAQADLTAAWKRLCRKLALHKGDKVWLNPAALQVSHAH